MPGEIRWRILQALPVVIFSILAVSGQVDGQPRDGSLSVTPQSALAGGHQEITYTYTVGADGIEPGGGIRFELPVAYGETEHYFFSKPQSENPEGLGYVSATASAGARIEVKTYGLSGGIFECSLADKVLEPGDQIIATYRGVVQTLAWDVEVRHAVRRAASDSWRRIADPPYLEITPERAHTLITSQPADLSKGETFDLAVVLIDKYGNQASHFDGTVELDSTDPQAILPERVYTFGKADAGIRVFPGCRFESAGFQTIRATVTTHPVKSSWHHSYVWEEKPGSRRFFGETHFHTGTGTNHAGFFALEDQADVNELSLEDFQKLNSGGDHRANFTNARDAYAYVRDVMRLDFASSSEHDMQLFDGAAWAESRRITSDFYEPGRFTTFFAYEWTPGFNHHIVLYKDPDTRVFYRENHPTLPELWSQLERQGKPAITIPHITWPFEDHLAWKHLNNDYRRIGEIYSLWNSRFLVMPDDQPQRFELGKEKPWSYQHAWAHGHKVGLIGSTDNHLGHPGANNYSIHTFHTGGLAAVLAPENNRGTLWAGMHARRTYATTGTRIYMDFKVNGHDMGSEIAADAPPSFTVRVGGTNQLKTVEVVKFSNDRYTTIHQSAPDSPVLEWSGTDPCFEGDSLYYLRVTQEEEYPGRPYSHSTSEMAWSSPVWVTDSRKP